MNRCKRILAWLLMCCMILSVLPASVFASGGELSNTSAPETEIWEMPALQTTGYEIASFALDPNGNPQLKDSNEIRWIDRIADLPAYATDFYSWLEENSDGDGSNDALIDPSTATTLNGNYVCPVVSYNNVPVSFTFSPGASQSEISAIVDSVIKETARKYVNAAYPYVLTVFSAFDRDHPEVFWFSGNTQIGYSYPPCHYTYNSNGTGTIDFSVTIAFYLTVPAIDFDVRAEQYRNVNTIRSEIAARDAAVGAITEKATGSRLEQLQYLNSWLTKHNCYNTSSNLDNIAHDCRECTSALKGQTGKDGPVCEGYARAFKVLCDTLDIPCVLVDGYGKSEPHMWNYVQMEDGKWYAVDCTWNDPSVNVVTGAVSGQENENYLLVGSSTVIKGSTFSSSHRVVNMVTDGGVAFTNGPVLAEDRYEPSSESGSTLSGTVLSYLEETDKVTIQLIGSNGAVAYSATVTGCSTKYTIKDISSGTYTMQVSKANHVTRSYTVTVEEDTELDVAIYPIGDVTCDGEVSGKDCASLLSHVKGIKLISDAYLLLCADVTGDGEISGKDCAALLSHVKGIKSLFEWQN